MLMFDPKETLASLRHHRISLQGAGAAAPLVVVGHGITVTRPAIGRILITWVDNPGTFVGMGNEDFRDATQANVKGCTCTGGVYPATANTFTFEVDIWSSAFAAFDLAATSFLDLDLVFSELKVP